jgi:3-hydroxyacyl-[acyl-carrier-protein] dehydratase
MRFLHPVVPGDQLKIFIEPVKIISTAGIVKAQAFVAEKEVACGELSFMAT